MQNVYPYIHVNLFKAYKIITPTNCNISKKKGIPSYACKLI